MANTNKGNQSKKDAATNPVYRAQPTNFPEMKSTKKTTKKATSTSPKNKVTTPGNTVKVVPEPKLGFEIEEKSIYEYAIGIKDISISAKSYEETGMYVSKPIEIEGNVMEVLLDAQEEHPLFDNVSDKATFRRTSVEYSITTASKPSQNDWIPILPQDQKVIKAERLFLKNGVGRLRFVAELDSIIVYKNGRKMKSSEFVSLEQGQLLQVKTPDLGAIYTMDYKPNVAARNPWTIDVSQLVTQRSKQVDTFPNGTNHNKTVVLSKYPYVDLAYINTKKDYDANTDSYKPFQVFLRNGSIFGKNKTVIKEVRPQGYGDAISTIDKTLYKEDKWADLKSYSIVPNQEYQNFEYYNWKNKLMFSETFNRASINNTDFRNEEFSNGNAEIEVHYEYLVAAFRIKIVLRRNAPDRIMTSPYVHDYRLHFKIQK